MPLPRKSLKHDILGWIAVALIYIGLSWLILSDEAHAGTVAEPHTISWDNPTLRTNGEPIIGAVTVTANCYREDGSGAPPVAITAEPQAESVTFVPRELGMTPGDWLCYGVAEEAGNTAGPSEPSETAAPFALTTIPDAPPHPPAMREVVARAPSPAHGPMIAATRLQLRPSD